MLNRLDNISPLANSRIAGILYLMLVPLGFFSMYASSLVEPGNVAVTIKNIFASESLFRLSVVSALMTQVVNIVLVLALYRLLKPVNRIYALLMVVFIMAAAPIAMLNELNNFAILVLSGADSVATFTAAQSKSLIPFFLALHEYGVAIAGIFWGLWLFPMGYLVYKSNFIPKFIGVLLMIACFGYLADSFSLFFSSNHDVNVAIFTFWGELLLPLWLLTKGINVEQWKKHALQPLKEI